MQRKRITSLTAMRTFEAVARTLSFTRAADELGVTQAAVSRQIRLLEDSLSVRLVHREAAGNRLTDAGEILFAGVYAAFETIEQAVEQVTGSGTREILNVSVAPYFSAAWLTPRLMSFVGRHPEIDLRLHHSYHPADHRREGIDIGINWGSGAWPGVRAEKVLDGSLTAVLAPALLREIGPVADPAALLRLPLFYEFEFGHWRAWARAAGRHDAVLAEGLRLSDSHALRRVACDGHGVALFFAALIEEDLAQGRLVQPFPVKAHVGADYFLNYPDGRELPRKARLFRRWLMDMLAGA